MFTTSSNFNRQPYSIPNINLNQGFDNYADQEEKKRLKKLLGVAFYLEFVNALDSLPDDYSPTVEYALDALVVSGNNVYKSLQAANTGHPVTDGAWWVLTEENNKYLLLLNGEVFEYGGCKYEWEGMVELFKPYVFSRYVEHNVTEFTGSGTVSSNNENAVVVAPVKQIVSAWNDFADRTKILYLYLEAKEASFDEDIYFSFPGYRNFAGI